jgi:hypothetical protein
VGWQLADDLHQTGGLRSAIYGLWSNPDPLVKKYLGVRSWLGGDRSTSCAGVCFYVDGGLTFDRLVDVVAFLGVRLAAAPPLKPCRSSRAWPS